MRRQNFGFACMECRVGQCFTASTTEEMEAHRREAHPTPEEAALRPLVEKACKRWLGYQWDAGETDEDGHLTSKPFWRVGLDPCDLPEPDGNLLVRLCDAMAAAGHQVTVTWHPEGFGCLCLVARVYPTAMGHVASGIGASPLEATLCAAAVPVEESPAIAAEAR